MRRAIDFLDLMVRDIFDFDYARLQELTTKELTICILPTAPLRAYDYVIPRVSAMLTHKYTTLDVSETSAGINLDLIVDRALGLRVKIHWCYELQDVLGATCVGAMVDGTRMLDKPTQRALHNSMLVMRHIGFTPHQITLPLEF